MSTKTRPQSNKELISPLACACLFIGVCAAAVGLLAWDAQAAFILATALTLIVFGLFPGLVALVLGGQLAIETIKKHRIIQTRERSLGVGLLSMTED